MFCRYWDLIQKHSITLFYTAPTAIRTLMRFDPAPIAGYNLSTLRVLGSVGEPINPEAWRWYHTHVGRGVCSISDTYWQTETGAHLATSLPGWLVTIGIVWVCFICLERRRGSDEAWILRVALLWYRFCCD